MKRRLWTLVVAVSVLGCGDDGAPGDGQNERAGTARTDAGAGERDSLAGGSGEEAATVWALRAMKVKGQTYTPVEGSTVTLTFGDGNRVFGSAGVNRYEATLVTDESGRHAFPGGIATTKMAGPPELMAQEQMFLDALARTDLVLIEKDGIVLMGEDGSVRLEFGVEG